MVPSSCVCGLTPTGVAATGVAVSGVMSSAARAVGAEVENSIDLASEAARIAVTCRCASVEVIPNKVLLTAGWQVEAWLVGSWHVVVRVGVGPCCGKQRWAVEQGRMVLSRGFVRVS